jgi:hypothetical protein
VWYRRVWTSSRSSTTARIYPHKRTSTDATYVKQVRISSAILFSSSAKFRGEQIASGRLRNKCAKN